MCPSSDSTSESCPKPSVFNDCVHSVSWCLLLRIFVIEMSKIDIKAWYLQHHSYHSIPHENQFDLLSPMLFYEFLWYPFWESCENRGRRGEVCGLASMDMGELLPSWLGWTVVSRESRGRNVIQPHWASMAKIWIENRFDGCMICEAFLKWSLEDTCWMLLDFLHHWFIP
jgi:hypothetical protein